MSNTVNNPTKVITGPNTRWSYCNAWEQPQRKAVVEQDGTV